MLGIPDIREQIVQLITAMHHHEQGIGGGIPVEPYHIPQPRSIARVAAIGLVGLVGFELPDTAGRIQDRTGSLTGRALDPILQLAGIGISPDIDI